MERPRTYTVSQVKIFNKRKGCLSEPAASVAAGSDMSTPRSLAKQEEKKMATMPPSDNSEMQMVVLDATFRIRGYRHQTIATAVIWLLIVLSFGTLGLLLLYWKRDWFLKLTHKHCSLATAEVVYIKDAYGQKFVRKVRTMRKVRQSRFIRRAEPQQATDDERPLHMYDDVGENEEICEFRWFNYQKRKYWWESKSQTFKPLIGPNVVKRENIDTVRGMSQIDTQIRSRLFGKNEIRVNIDPIFRIFILEALNPFYIFQIFSVILWYHNNYMYFACCIVFMSSLSCGYTIVQTRAMQRMLRDRFQSSGDVIVLRQGFDDGEPDTELKGPPAGHDGGGGPSSSDKEVAVADNVDSNNIHHTTLSTLIPVSSSSSDLMAVEADVAAVAEEDNTEFVTGSDLLDECRVIESNDGAGNVEAVIIMNNDLSYPSANENGTLLVDNGGGGDAESHRLVNSNSNVTVIPGAANTDEIIITTPVGTGKAPRMPPSPLKRYGSFDPATRARTRSGTGQSNKSAAIMPPPTPTSPFFADGTDGAESDEVYRIGIDSSALVPGDIFIIPKHGCEMFCDAVLLSGSCIVNESSLTGESVPVTKTAYTFDGTEPGSPNDPTRLYYSAKNLTAKSTLFAGTRVIQTRYYGSEAVKATILRTGFNTVKGELVRSILYPKPVDFTFYREAYKFLLALAALASVGMVYCMVILTMWQRPLKDVVMKALDLITIVVPPALPVALTVGVVHAQARMKKLGLFCISPRMINMAGSVNIVCFDKTGTLTEEGLNIRGVVPVEHGRLSKMVSHLALSSISPNQFSSTHLLSFDTHLLNCMATCHSLTLIDGKLCGDPLDLEMWKAIDWELEEPEVQDSAKYDLLLPTVVRPKATTNVESSFTHEHLDDIGIVRVFAFESQLQRMSVVTKHIHDDRFHLYAKGSPEMISSLCVEDSVPTNFRAVLDAFTQDGDRVLALAHRTLTERRYPKLQRMPRQALESEMEFIGLLVFENRLKPQSIACIRELKAAFIRPVMVTGDNLLTALSVGRQCGIVDSSISVVEVAKEGGRIKRHSVTPEGSTSNAAADVSLATTTTTLLTPLKSSSSKVEAADDEEEIDENAIVTVGHYAVTGDTFDALKKRHPVMYAEVLRHGGIFARMSPSQKETLVEDLKHLGYYVGMCGDGANDCGALSAAHMGISLSDQEASAAATFTYKHANVSCVPTCIKEGRAALDASFGAFKFMAGYSLTQFVSVLILYWFLYIDMFEITIISLVFGSTAAYPRLVRRAPPTRLLAFVPMFSLLSQVGFIACAQLGIYALLQFQPWYVPLSGDVTVPAMCQSHAPPQNNITAADIDEHDVKEAYYSYENFSVYTLSAFQYIWLAIAFSRGHPYRRTFFTNKTFLALCILFTLLNVYVTLYACKFFECILQLLVPPSVEFRFVIVMFAALNLVIAIVLEWGVVKFVRNKMDDETVSEHVSSTKIVSVDVSSHNVPLTTPSLDARRTAMYNVDQEKLELGDYTPTIGGARILSITNEHVENEQKPSSSGV